MAINWRFWFSIGVLIILLALPAYAQDDPPSDNPTQVAIVLNSGDIRASHPVNTLAFSPHGALMASGGQDGLLALWDMASGRNLAMLEGHGAAILSLAFSPDGALLASGGDDATLRLWSLAGTSPRLQAEWQPHQSPITALAFSADSTILASGGLDHTIALYHVPTATHLGTLEHFGGAVHSLAFHPDGGTLAAAGESGDIWLYGLWGENGVSLQVLRGVGAVVYGVAFHPTGRYIAAAAADGRVYVWDIHQQPPLLRTTLQGHQGAVNAVRFSADGATIISTGEDGTVRFWSLSTGEPLDDLLSVDVPLQTLAFSGENNLLAAAGLDGSLHIWNIADHSERLALDIAAAIGSQLVNTSPPPVAVAPPPAPAPNPAPASDTDVSPEVVAAPPPVSVPSGPNIALPTVGINTYITSFPLDGVSWAIDPWERGVGHLQGTAWLNQNGNIALGGHSLMPDGRPGIFNRLYNVNIGDPIIVTDENGVQTQYIVTDIRTVHYQDLSVIYPTSERQLTLITCDIPSFDGDSQSYIERLIVVARPA